MFFNMWIHHTSFSILKIRSYFFNMFSALISPFSLSGSAALILFVHLKESCFVFGLGSFFFFFFFFFFSFFPLLILRLDNIFFSIFMFSNSFFCLPKYAVEPIW